MTTLFITDNSLKMDTVTDLKNVNGIKPAISFSEACSWSTASSAMVVPARVSLGDIVSASLFLRAGELSSPVTKSIINYMEISL